MELDDLAQAKEYQQRALEIQIETLGVNMLLSQRVTAI